MSSSQLRLPLILIGFLILAVVVWRQWQLEHWQTTGSPVRAAPRRLAPRFELADQHRKIVKFERFLGRQRVVLVFLDDGLPPASDPRLLRLLQCYDAISEVGLEVVAVSTASPFALGEVAKKLGSEIPFPVLSDISPTPPDKQVHRLWGRIDSESEDPIPGVFLIARDGTIAVDRNGMPMPVEDEDAAFEALCDGEWPR